MAVLESGGGNPSVNIINPGGVEGGVALEALVRVTQAARDRKLQREMNQAKMQQEQDMFQQEQNFAREQAAQASALQQQQFGLEEKRLGLDEKRVGLDQQQLVQQQQQHNAEMQQRKEEVEQRMVMEQSAQRIALIESELVRLDEEEQRLMEQGDVEAAAEIARQSAAKENELNDLSSRVTKMQFAVTLQSQMSEKAKMEMIQFIQQQQDGKVMHLSNMSAELKDVLMMLSLTDDAETGFENEEPSGTDRLLGALSLIDPSDSLSNFGEEGKGLVGAEQAHANEKAQTGGLGKKSLKQWESVAQVLARHVHGEAIPKDVELRLQRVLAAANKLANDTSDEAKQFRSSYEKLLNEDLQALQAQKVDMAALGDALVLLGQGATGSTAASASAEGQLAEELKEGGERSVKGVSGEGSNSQKFQRINAAIRKVQFAKDKEGKALFPLKSNVNMSPEMMASSINDAITAVLGLEKAEEGIAALLSESTEDDMKVFGKAMGGTISGWSFTYRKQLADLMTKNIGLLESKLEQEAPGIKSGKDSLFYRGAGQFNRGILQDLEEEQRVLGQKVSQPQMESDLLEAKAKSSASAKGKTAERKAEARKRLEEERKRTLKGRE
jgi:hypothetical protein